MGSAEKKDFRKRVSSAWFLFWIWKDKEMEWKTSSRHPMGKIYRFTRSTFHHTTYIHIASGLCIDSADSLAPFLLKHIVILHISISPEQQQQQQHSGQGPSSQPPPQKKKKTPFCRVIQPFRSRRFISRRDAGGFTLKVRHFLLQVIHSQLKLTDDNLSACTILS